MEYEEFKKTINSVISHAKRDEEIYVLNDYFLPPDWNSRTLIAHCKRFMEEEQSDHYVYVQKPMGWVAIKWS